ncbi:hypothetical protein [Actinomadura livida]|uniref:Uncharacterized protein n=1 Tax=Actinomadura livida TaxID=79909 RepID=A0A7W7MYQ2_9ACTN|nr:MULTISPECIES: hypothetical protein [Actinomadura]MBB4776136.1 hypothetical protein [Actinomadura catellatispora]GGU15239.1 hypothetical protein GCM10010208_45260 [Actinomadura livida]
MTDDLDRALRGTLTTAARKAPPAEPGLLQRIEAGHRRRRRRRASAAALAAAVVLGGTGAAGGLMRSGEDAPPVAAPGKLKPVSRAALGAPVKVREQWPDAVRSIPGELPNGRELHPVDLLDGGTLVGATWSSLQKPDELWSYDLDTQKAAVITDIVVPRGSKIYASDITVGGGQVVWWLSYRVEGRDTVEIWGAPVAGGAARKVTGMRGDSVSTLLIDGDTVVWGMEDAVYRVPLPGGTPEEIPGTGGFEIVSWPWIGSPAADGDRAGYIRYRSLWNVRTGERRGAHLAPLKGAWSCGVIWCVGATSRVRGATDDRGMVTAVQLRDGRAGKALPFDDPMGPGRQIVYGRFLPYFPKGLRTENHVLYDVETGKLLDTGIRRYNEVMGRARNDRDPHYFVTNKDGTTLIDLSKIR